MSDTALRLADALGIVSVGGPLTVTMHEAAAELRRLHALNAELVEALRGLAGEVERFGLHHPDGNSNWWPVALEKAQAALAKVASNES